MVLCNLARSGLVFPTYSQSSAPCFTTYKSETKPWVIMEFRSYNVLFADPPRFRSPHFDSVLSARWSLDLYFVKIDVANFHWSLCLPPPVLGYFAISSGVVGYTTYGTYTMFAFCMEMVSKHCTDHPGANLATCCRLVSRPPMQYLEDVLIVCCDPYFLQFALHFAKHLISNAGLLVSIKSSEYPVITITWLGKTVSATTVQILPSSMAAALAHIWLLRGSLLTHRRLMRVLGICGGYYAQTPFVHPFWLDPTFCCNNGCSQSC